MPGFAYIWEYWVRTDKLDAFRHAYGSDGAWVALFSRANGYLRTELYRDADDPSRFVTIDHWTSRQARDDFRLRFASEFEAIDRRCEELTERERLIGDFEIADSGRVAPGGPGPSPDRS